MCAESAPGCISWSRGIGAGCGSGGGEGRGGRREKRDEEGAMVYHATRCPL